MDSVVWIDLYSVKILSGASLEQPPPFDSLIQRNIPLSRKTIHFEENSLITVLNRQENICVYIYIYIYIFYFFFKKSTLVCCQLLHLFRHERGCNAMAVNQMNALKSSIFFFLVIRKLLSEKQTIKFCDS